MMSRMKLLGFWRGSSLIPMSVTHATRRFLGLSGPPGRRGTTRPPETPGSGPTSAARVVGDREPEPARRRVVLEVVAGALELRRRDQEPEHGGLVGRILTLLGLIAVHQALDRRQRGLVGDEPGSREGTVLLQLLDSLRRRGEILHQQKAGDSDDRHHDDDLDEAEAALAHRSDRITGGGALRRDAVGRAGAEERRERPVDEGARGRVEGRTRWRGGNNSREESRWRRCWTAW